MQEETRPASRRWQVLLLGGASGVGKTAVSYRLAHHFAVGITDVDDFQVLLERMTTPEQQPALHWRRTSAAFARASARQVMEQSLEIGRSMRPGLEGVIACHLHEGTPVVLQGDHLLPDLASQASFSGQANDGRVQAVFLHEPDEQQILANYLAREPRLGPQVKRARVSWLKSQWLKQEAERCGFPVVASRPWDNVLERLIAAVS
jgi:2-phosphoglycerate kinase